MAEDFEFIVFNDANNEEMAQNIDQVCKDLNIKCIRVPQIIHDLPYLARFTVENYNHPAIRNCNVVQYSLNKYGFGHDDYILLIDSDLFLVKQFSIIEHMRGYQISGLLQSYHESVQYLWIGLILMDFNSMPNKHSINFNCGRVNDTPVDAGGYTYHYIKCNNPTIKFLNQFSVPDLKDKINDIQCIKKFNILELPK